MNISIITPSFKQGRFIERTILSVLKQDYPGLEYVIFDGGSKDNTIEILQKYSDKLSWVSEKDNGQTHAVNKGLQATTGEIIGWLNSDDIYYPGALETIADYFEKNPEIDVIYGHANHIDIDDTVIELYPTELWNWERLCYTCYICQPAVFFRRSVVEKYGLLNEKLQYCMDYEYWLRLAKSGAAFAYLPQILAGSRLYQETKTLGARKNVHREINNMLKAKLGKVPDRWISNYAHVVIETQGVGRDTPVRFAASIAFLSFYYSLFWNKSISLDLLKTITAWLKTGIFSKKTRSS